MFTDVADVSVENFVLLAYLKDCLFSVNKTTNKSKEIHMTSCLTP